MNLKQFAQNGYTLIEVVIVIIIIGIMAGIASKSLMVATETSRIEETKEEMEFLTYSIAGDPKLITGGIRTDYGYVGDIGAMPPNWDALVTNPGGYAAWNGPYIQDEFAGGATNSEFKLDGWGVQYSAPSSNSFSSTGGPSTITRIVANSTDNLLYNTVRLSLSDLGFAIPGTNNVDSVKCVLFFPNGSGSITSKSSFPTANGYVEIDSIPIGIHTLQIIFIPQNDTLIRKVNINPGEDYYAEIQYFENIW